MKRFFTIYVMCLLISFNTKAQLHSPVNITTLRYTVEEAPEWTALLKRNSGWFGGDGIFTMPLNGVEHKPGTIVGKVLFLFSDSMVGNIRDNKLLPGSVMLHNSVGILKGTEADKSRMTFYWDKNSQGKPESIFIPKTPKTEKGDYFWLGDGFVNQELNNNIYVFGYRIKNVSDAAFGFKEVGNVLIKIPAGDKPPYLMQQQKDTPFYVADKGDGAGSFGAGIYVNTRAAGAPAPDGYVYVYGVVSKWKNLLVARVLPKNFEKFDKWTYWDGRSWSSDIAKAQKVADWVSNELSVSPLPDGRYAMIFQIGTMTKDVGLRIGKTPYGPFGPAIKIWDCSKDLTNKNYFVYNAKAHPALSKAGELIISYNINSTNFFKDLPNDPNLYRPRFIRLKFN
jgi:hypothetical protein